MMPLAKTKMSYCVSAIILLALALSAEGSKRLIKRQFGPGFGGGGFGPAPMGGFGPGPMGGFGGGGMGGFGGGGMGGFGGGGMGGFGGGAGLGGFGGAGLGAGLGAGIGAGIGAQAGAQVGGQIGGSIGASIGGSIGGSLGLGVGGGLGLSGGLTAGLSGGLSASGYAQGSASAQASGYAQAQGSAQASGYAGAQGNAYAGANANAYGGAGAGGGIAVRPNVIVEPDVQIQVPFETTTWNGFRMPSHFVNFFNNGQMNWLNPDRYALLRGGRFDVNNRVWITGDGLQIRPGTPVWNQYFGNFGPNDLSLMFPSGGYFNDMFGFINPDFFNRWTGWQPIETTSWNGLRLPSNFVNFFNNGQMNWLNPDRYALLQGGRFDVNNLVWITGDGLQIRPGTPGWNQYFGNFGPNDLQRMFPSGGYFNDMFGFVNPDFFNRWTGWQQQQVIPSFDSIHIRIPGSARISPHVVNLFQNGQLNWLNPAKIQFLRNGRWDGSRWITPGGLQIVPGSDQWARYFGGVDASQFNTIFGPSGGEWNSEFDWLNDVVKDVPEAYGNVEFPWDQMFQSYHQVLVPEYTTVTYRGN